MAFLKDPSEDDDLLTAKPQDGSSAGGFAGDAPSSGGSPAATSSGNYTNLQDYLSGNQTGEQKMADNLTSNVNGAGNTAKDANQQYIDIASKVISDSPSGSAYSGPSDYSHLSGDALDAQTRARTLASGASDKVDQVTGGFDKLGSYLKDQVNDPGYSAGENGLDTFLTGASDAGKNAISDAKSNWSDIGSSSDAADDAVNGAIDGQKSKAFDPILKTQGVGADTIGFPTAKTSVPTTRSLPAGVPNSGREQVQNYPAEPVAKPPVAAASSGDYSTSTHMNKFANGGLIEPEEKTPFGGLMNKLRSKK